MGTTKLQILFICVFALAGFVVFRNSKGLEAFEYFIDKSPKCTRRDSEGLKAMARDMRSYFEGANILGHPWVLTMVAALRYGANSVEVDSRVHTVDHDIDIRIVRPPGMTIEDVVGNLTLHLQDAGHWVRGFPGGIPRVGQRNACLLFFGSSTHLGWMQATIMLPRVVRMFIEKSNVGQKPVIGALMKAIGELISYPLGFLVAPIWSLFTVVDLHWDTIQGVQPHPNRSVLWAGQRWPFPLGGERVFRFKFAAYVGGLAHGDPLILFKLQRFCDFYLPKGRWVEDLTESEGAADASRQCGASLKASGYFSFAEVCEEGGPKIEEVDKWPAASNLKTDLKTGTALAGPNVVFDFKKMVFGTGAPMAR